MEALGPAETLKAIKPYGNIYGQNIAEIGRRTGTVQGDDVLSVAMPYYYGVYSSSDGDIEPMEIRDGKAVVEIHACPTVMVGSPPELCAMSHFNSEGVCQAINPDYEYVWTHHLNAGDDCCRFIVKKKSARLKSEESKVKTLPFLNMFRRPVDIDTEEIGKLERTIPMTIPQPEKDLTSLTIASTYFNMFTAASVEKIGSQRTMELGKPLAMQTGIKLGSKWKVESGGIADLDVIKERLGFIQTVLNQKGEPANASDSSIEREVVDCPFKGASPEQCIHLEGVLAGICEAINPDYEFVYDRMMSKGESSCHWVVKKKTVDTGAKQQETTSDDSLGY